MLALPADAALVRALKEESETKTRGNGKRPTMATPGQLRDFVLGAGGGLA